MFMWLLLTVQWLGLQCMVVLFPDHTHSLFGIYKCSVVLPHGAIGCSAVCDSGIV